MNRAIFIITSALRGFVKEFGRLGANVKTYVIYGILYDIMFNLYKPYAPKFAERLGGTELHLSLVTSLPGLFAVLALIPCSILLAGVKNKQKITAIFFAVSRMFLPLMALTPLLPQKSRAMVFVIILSAMNFPDSVSQAALQSFLGELFHPRKRAEAIAIRSKFGNMATTAALIISCLVLNYAVSDDSKKILVYQIFFMISFLFGVAEIYVFMKLKPGVTQAAPQHFDFRRSFPKIMGDRRFIVYCLILFAFHFGYFMGFPLSNIVLIKKLNANEFWVGASAITSVAGVVLSSTFWGRMLVKKGTGYVLALCGASASLNCFLMAISPNAAIYTLFGLFGGWFSCGVNLGVLNGLLESTPDQDRVVYVGVFQTFINFTLSVAPLFAHMVYSATNLDISLGITALFRGVCALAIFFTFGKRREAV